MNHTTFLMTRKMQHVLLVLGLLICLELVSLHLMTENLLRCCVFVTVEKLLINIADKPYTKPL